MKEIKAVKKEPFRDQEDYTEEIYTEKPQGRITGFLAMALTVLYALYIILYFGSFSDNVLAMAIINNVVGPHLVCVAVAAIFTIVGLFGKKRWAMLTSGILLAVSAVLMMSYAPMVIVQMILCFIAYVRMGKIKERVLEKRFVPYDGSED